MCIYRIVGSVVEFSPATRETGVRFPDNAYILFVLFYYGSKLRISFYHVISRKLEISEINDIIRKLFY